MIFEKKIPLYIGILCLCIILVGVHATYSYLFRPIGRIDLTVPIEQAGAIDVYSIKNRYAFVPEEKKLVWWPEWMVKSRLYGRIYESNAGEAHLDIHVYNPCQISLRFLGSDAFDMQYNRLNPKVTFTSIKINNFEILKEPKTVSHDESYYWSFPVSPGLVRLDAVWFNPIIMSAGRAYEK